MPKLWRKGRDSNPLVPKVQRLSRAPGDQLPILSVEQWRRVKVSIPHGSSPWRRFSGPFVPAGYTTLRVKLSKNFGGPRETRTLTPKDWFLRPARLPITPEGQWRALPESNRP